LVIGAVVRRVIGFKTVAKTTFVLSTIFANVSRVVALVTNDARGFGRKAWGRNESCAYCGELTVPVWTVNGWGRSRADGNFNPRGGFRRYDNWSVRVAWIAGEVTGSRAFAFLLLLFFCFFFFVNRLLEESGSFLFDPLGF